MPKVYTCKICGATSDKALFYQGVTSRCKECHKDRVRENRAAKVNYYRAYDAKRFQDDPRVKERHRRYQKTDAGKASMQKSRETWQLKNAEKRAAHVILNNAVRDGRVAKPETCSRCGAGDCRIEGHHDDYAFPLMVEWLCRQCHVDHHKENDQ